MKAVFPTADESILSENEKKVLEFVRKNPGHGAVIIQNDTRLSVTEASDAILSLFLSGLIYTDRSNSKFYARRDDE